MVIDLNVNGGVIIGGRVVEYGVMFLVAMANEVMFSGMRIRGA